MFEFSTEEGAVSCQLTNSVLQICKQGQSSEVETTDFNDIIGVSTFAEDTDEDGDTIQDITLYTIKKSDTKIWKQSELKLSGRKDDCKQFTLDVESRISKLSRPKRLLILICPVAGSHQGESVFYERVKPLLDLANITTDVIVSEYTDHIRTLVPTYDLRNTDGIVVMGGDGSFNQCLNGMFERTQKAANVDCNDPEVKLSPSTFPIGQIPTGTKNVASSYCYGCEDVETAVLHIIRGATNKIGILNVYSNKTWIGCSSIAAGYGLLAEVLHYTEGFRWMKTLRYLFVPSYYYLMKTLPLFEATIKLRKRDGSEEIVKGPYMDTLAVLHDTFKPGEYIGSETWKDDRFNARIYNPASRYQLWKNFMSKIFYGPRYVSPDFIDKYEVTMINVCIHKTNYGHTSSGDTRYRIMLDGEYIEIDHGEIEFRVSEPMVSVFSSL